jgi:hypothetical protein
MAYVNAMWTTLFRLIMSPRQHFIRWFRPDRQLRNLFSSPNEICNRVFRRVPEQVNVR